MSASDPHGIPSDEHDGNSQTPLLKKPKRQARLASTKVSLLLQDWWLWELLSALLAILSTTAIIVILVRYDGSSLPDWPSVLTVRR